VTRVNNSLAVYRSVARRKPIRRCKMPVVVLCFERRYTISLLGVLVPGFVLGKCRSFQGNDKVGREV